MTTDPAQRNRSRTLSSRTNLEKDMDLLRRYSSRYLPQTNGSYRPGQFSESMTNMYNGRMNSNISVSSSTSKSLSPSPESQLQHEKNKLSNSSIGSSASTGNDHTNGKQSEHERRRSNLINTQSLQNWDDTSMDSTSQEMSEAMRSMVESMQTRVDAQHRLVSEMEQRATQDNDFGKPENADQWNTLEVCYWLNSIHLQKYIDNFNGLSIDGSILLHDLDETILANELGIKKIHLKKCFREINKLKEAVTSREKATEAEKSRRIEELEKRIATLRQNNLKLKGDIDLMKEQARQPPQAGPQLNKETNAKSKALPSNGATAQKDAK